MANYCSNWINIQGSVTQIKKLKKIINGGDKSEIYNSLYTIFPKTEEDPRWFDIEVQSESEDNIVLSGDSAWCPAVDLMEKVGARFKSFVIVYEYEEAGCNFAGVANIKNGVCIDNCETYWKGKYINDGGYALSCAIDELDNYESLEELKTSDMYNVFTAEERVALENEFNLNK